jgi:hypothetical protein
MLQHANENALPSLADGIFPPEICGAVSDEQGERFHQVISSIEKRYEGKLNCAILADCWWTLARDDRSIEYKRQAKQNKTKQKFHDFVCVQ